MTWLSHRGLRSTASALALLVAGRAAGGELERLERFKEQTVMITVTHRDRSVGRGAGVVLCQEYGRAYVLTAFDLLAGDRPASSEHLRRPARTEIRFYDHRLPSFVEDRAAATPAGEADSRRGVTLYKHGEFTGPRETFYEDDPNLKDNPIGNDTVSSVRVDPGCRAELFEHVDYQGRSSILTYEAERLWDTEVGRDSISSLKVSCQEIDEQGLTFHQVPEDYLVLLSFPFQQLAVTAATRRGIFEVTGSRGIFTSEQPTVSTVGYRTSSMESWAQLSGRLLPGRGRFLHYSAAIDSGFLGGPLFNKRSLIGINLRRVAGEEIGAAAGGFYGEALSIQQILPAIGKWLPDRCRTWIERRVALFLPPPSDSALPQLWAKAEKLKVKHRRSLSEKLRFGPHQVASVHRGSIVTSSSRWRQTYDFSFTESEGPIWEAKCILGADPEEVDPGPDWTLRLELLGSASLVCDFQPLQGEASGRILMRERSAAEPAKQDVRAAGAVEIDVVSTPNAAEETFGELPADYLFSIEDRAIGAIGTSGEGAVWLHPSAAGETRSAFLVAAAAMLLDPDLESPEQEEEPSGTRGPTERDSLSKAFQAALFERQEPEALPLDPERLAKQTVMIAVTFDDHSVEQGTGVVLCQENRRAHVLTAHHVLAGKQPAGGNNVVRRVERTEIQFFRQSVPSVVDDRTAGQAVMTVRWLPEVDLALLSIPVLGDPGSAGSAIRPSHWARALDSQPDEPTVLAMGFSKSPLESWTTVRGALLPGSGDLLHHTAPITEGFSGGPVYYRSGELIGINLGRIAGESIGGEAGAFYGEALPIERIVPLIRQWLPESCLTTMENALETPAGGMTGAVVKPLAADASSYGEDPPAQNDTVLLRPSVLGQTRSACAAAAAALLLHPRFEM